MNNRLTPPDGGRRTGPQDLPAGPFSPWLRRIRNSLLTGEGMDVPCGECRACCTSSQFIHVGREEAQTLGRIDPRFLWPSPGSTGGERLLGYYEDGRCPMLTGGLCSIYGVRPLACRNYDCRIFAAAGVAAGGPGRERIAEQAGRWKFGYPAALDRDEHEAVRAAAKFIRGHAECFPGGAVPSDPGQLAVLAIKVCGVFLKKGPETAGASRVFSDIETCDAVVAACREFDARRSPRR